MDKRAHANSSESIDKVTDESRPLTISLYLLAMSIGGRGKASVLTKQTSCGREHRRQRAALASTKRDGARFGIRTIFTAGSEVRSTKWSLDFRLAYAKSMPPTNLLRPLPSALLQEPCEPVSRSHLTGRLALSSYYYYSSSSSRPAPVCGSSARISEPPNTDFQTTLETWAKQHMKFVAWVVERISDIQHLTKFLL
ncbi:hypothetical protein CLAIMM_09446 isoform 2 [Cladophialophora immunda]|nr:hypothetical protein CLAIMM_09446 isoform 2 [Cladophialophora immunda]